MLNRSELKSRAKAAFKGKYWWTFAACLAVSAIIAILGGGSLLSSGFTPGFTISLNGFIDGYNSGYHDIESEYYYIDSELNDGIFAVLSVIILVLILVFGIISVVGICKSIFISDPLKVGLRSYFMNNRENKAEFKDIFSVFVGGKYLNTVGTVFTTNLFVFLWSLLFVIPGIYHKYVYWLVPYICAGNPDVSASEARRLSRVMTEGYKLEIFVLELSFIGWRLLGGALIFGNHFIEPYIQATYAELYAELRDKAVANGKIKPEEVGLPIENVFEY